MSSVFISHSSRDKPFVRKLATALLSDGFPVWLDSWKLELGDSLVDRIFEGIETSSIVLLVVSKDSNESGWVDREVSAALAKERSVGRRFLIPLKIDESQVPPKLEDRLYGDFSDGFSAPMAALTGILEKCGARAVIPPIGHELVSLTFTREIHADKASLARALERIRKRQGLIKLTAGQVVVNDDAEYEALVRKLHRRIDSIGSDRYFSANLESGLRQRLDEVQTAERILSEGIALMASNGRSSEAMYWFARLVRSQGIYQAWSAQAPGDPDLSGYGRSAGAAMLASQDAAASFFETSRVETVVAWKGGMWDSHTGFGMWIGKEEIKRIRNDDGVYVQPQRLIDVCSYASIDKYVYPQMILKHLKSGAGPVLWDLEEAWVGIK